MAHSESATTIEIHPCFRNEDVYTIECVFCCSQISDRGMRSFLIADEKIELYSTDQVDICAVGMTGEKYKTDNCDCLLQDIACLQCGNVVGYHVEMPCKPCLQAQNNGHFWMFNRHTTLPSIRWNLQGTGTLMWGELNKFNEDLLQDAFWEECER